jgi:hypothetical protein
MVINARYYDEMTVILGGARFFAFAVDLPCDRASLEAFISLGADVFTCLTCVGTSCAAFASIISHGAVKAGTDSNRV